MVLYKILNIRNTDYNETQIQKMCLLYEGGYRIMEHAGLFMTKLSIETQKSYKERLKCAAYLPYLSQFVDQFGASLFSDDLVVKEASDADDDDTLGSAIENEDFYKVFAANCNMMNDSFHNFMKDTFTEGLYAPHAFIGVDFETVEQESSPINLLEEEAMGLSRAYLYDIDPLTVIDWKCNQSNQKYMWVKLRNDIIIQDDPLQIALKQVEFKIWTMNGDVAHWDLYRSRAIELDKDWRPNEDIPLAESGDTSFREIPVFCFQIPEGLHLGNKLGPVCEEYFQRRSFLVSNMNKTCISIPTVSLGPEISAPGNDLPSDVQSNPHRADNIRQQLADQGYTVIGADDTLTIVEASGSSHALVDKQLIDLREQMHQVVHQMAQSVQQNKMAQGRSAGSKQEDRHSTEILLTAYARIVKDFSKELYICIMTGRGESWIPSVEGLSTFVEEDRQTVITEMTAVAGKQSVMSLLPSPTFQKKYLTRLAMAMVGTLSPEEEATIQAEIEDGVEAGAHLDGYGSNDPDSPNYDPSKDPQAQAAQNAKPAPAGGASDLPSQQPPTISKSGNKALQPGSHTQTGQHVDPQIIFDLLSKDYNEKDLQWVFSSAWRGPVEIDVNDINFAGEQDWKANKPGKQGTEKVDKFAELLSDKGFTDLSPVILASMPHNDEKYTIIDGRHRVKAAQQAGVPVLAYIADVGSVAPNTPHMKLHGKQIGANNSSGG